VLKGLGLISNATRLALTMAGKALEDEIEESGAVESARTQMFDGEDSAVLSRRLSR
jgi:hypothetical protein